MNRQKVYAINVAEEQVQPGTSSALMGGERQFLYRDDIQTSSDDHGNSSTPMLRAVHAVEQRGAVEQVYMTGEQLHQFQLQMQQQSTSDSTAHDDIQHQRDLDMVRKRLDCFWAVRKKFFEDQDAKYYREISSKCELPMARVKKIMKIDYDMEGQMIAQDGPLFLSKAAELFVEELTLKAWANTEEQRRKTLQKNDISAACSRNEHFDFLIDIVPRDEPKAQQRQHWVQHQQPHRGSGAQVVTMAESAQMTAINDPNVQYILAENDNIMLQLENGQVVTATEISRPVPLGLGPQDARLVTSGGGGHILQVGTSSSQHAPSSMPPTSQTIVVTSNGLQMQEQHHHL